MTKFHLCAVSISTSFAIALTTTASDAALLQQARQVFQALPKNMATPESPIASARSQLGRSLFFDPRLARAIVVDDWPNFAGRAINSPPHLAILHLAMHQRRHRLSPLHVPFVTGDGKSSK